MVNTARDHAFMETQDAGPLGRIGDGDRISVGWTIASICVLLALLVAVNVMPEGVGITLARGESGQWVLRPPLDAIPSSLNLWLSLVLALNLTNLYYRRWHPATRRADLGLSVLAVFVLLELFRQVLTDVSSVHVLIHPNGAGGRAVGQIVQSPASWSTLVAAIVVPVALLCTLWRSARKVLALARR